MTGKGQDAQHVTDTIKWWPEEPVLPRSAKRMDAILSDAWAEYQRVKRHRDLMVENVLKRKQIAREQEAIIQRLAKERAELREEVELWKQAAEGVVAWPCDVRGTHIRMGDRVRYGDSHFEVFGFSYAIELEDWVQDGYGWRVSIGKRDGNKVSPGWYKVKPQQLVVLEDGEESVSDVLEEAMSYAEQRQYKGTDGDLRMVRSFVERINKLVKQ